MIKEEFISSMVIAYAPKRDQEKKQDYINRISTFAGKCPETHLQEVYDYAVMQEKYPGLKDILKFAKEKGFISESQGFEKKPVNWYYKCNGFYKDIQTGKDSEGKPVFVREKFSCSATYSKNGKACPNCGSTSAAVVQLKEGETFPSDMYECQEYCYMCEKYRPDGKGYGLRVYGPNCGIYGGYRSPEDDEQCKSCACRSCCIQAREYKFNSKNMIFDEDGNHRAIETGWLMPSRKPGDMVIDFSRVKNETKKSVKKPD